MSHHAKKSPSSSSRRFICAGSDNLIESLNIKDIPKRYTAEGTVGHTIGEKCIRDNVKPSSFIGRVFKQDGFTFTVNEEMIEAVQFYVDYIINLATNADLYLEQWYSLKWLNIEGLEGGTCDCTIIFIKRKIIHAIDYKHGKGIAVDIGELSFYDHDFEEWVDYEPVLSNVNSQLLHYGLSALKANGIKPGDNWKVYLTIIQPRAFHSDGPERTIIVSSDDIYRWCNEVLIPKVTASNDPNAPLIASETACRFCPVSMQAPGKCPALCAKTQEMALIDFAEDDVLPNVELLTAEQKQFIIDNGELLINFVANVKTQVYKEVINESDEYKNKYKLVRAKTNRKYTKDAFDEDFSPVFDHLSKDDIYTKKELPLTSIENKLKKEIGVKETAVIMNEITTKPEGGLVLANVTDKRKEITLNAIDDFEESEHDD